MTTDVEIIDMTEIITGFYKSYYKQRLNEIKHEIKRLNEMKLPIEAVFEVKYSDIVAYQSLFKHMEEKIFAQPEWAISELREAAVEYLIAGGVRPDVTVHITSIYPKMLIRDIREPQLNMLISIEGIVKKISDVRPRMTVGYFRCGHGHEMSLTQKYGHLKRPEKCHTEGCTSRKIDLVDRKSIFVDNQRMRIQESPEGLRGGQQPQSIDVDLLKELCGQVTPGDRITLNGIVRTYPKIIKGGESSIFDIYLEGHSIEISQSEYAQIEVTEEDEEQIRTLAKDQDIHAMIAASIAPSILGYIELKTAFAFQLFGGVPRNQADGSQLRGDIHILLVGDPGIAKSHMMLYVSRIAPRSVYTSGQSASKAGLTCSAVRDETDGRWTLEAGALVLADMGLALVDEIDKMSKTDRDALHEAMEQQTISVAKAGITATLNCRCALLAAANPKYGRFDPVLSLGEQVDMPPSLLSRFDLIYVLTDVPNRDDDEAIARHIAKNRSGQPTPSPIDSELLKKYISVARRLNPKINDSATDIIVNYYVDLRSKAKDSVNSAVPVTARQMEGTIRLAEASARIRLSEIATKQDALRAIEMADKCLRKIAYDARTNVWDIDGVATGKKKAERDMERTILQNLKDLSKESLKITCEDLAAKVVSITHWEPGTVTDRIEMMVRAGTFYLPDGKHIREA